MDMMAIRRRVLMGQISIPSGYRRIEYAESDGSAFVQLPFGFDRTDEVETRFALTKKSDNMMDKYIVAPNRWNDNTNRYSMGVHLGQGTVRNAWTIAFGNISTGGSYLEPVSTYDFLMHTWTFKDNVFAVEGMGLSRDVASSEFGQTTYPLKLFYGYNANTAGKIAYYKHKHDGVLYNIIPIQKISDGTVEMYDTVSKTIMPRTGTLLAPT